MSETIIDLNTLSPEQLQQLIAKMPEDMLTTLTSKRLAKESEDKYKILVAEVTRKLQSSTHLRAKRTKKTKSENSEAKSENSEAKGENSEAKPRALLAITKGNLHEADKLLRGMGIQNLDIDKVADRLIADVRSFIYKENVLDKLENIRRKLDNTTDALRVKERNEVLEAVRLTLEEGLDLDTFIRTVIQDTDSNVADIQSQRDGNEVVKSMKPPRQQRSKRQRAVEEKAEEPEEQSDNKKHNHNHSSSSEGDDEGVEEDEEDENIPMDEDEDEEQVLE